MKHIIHYNQLNEKYHSYTSNLIEYLDDDTIEEFFDEYYQIDIDEIVYLFPNMIWSHFDDKEFIEDFIDSMIYGASINDYDSYEYIDFIKNNLTDDKESKILEFYKEINDIEDIEDIYSDIDGTVEIIETKKGNTKIIVKSNSDEKKKYKISEYHKIIVHDDEIVKKGQILAQNDLHYNQYMLDELDNEQLIDVINVDNDDYDFLKETIENMYKYEDAEYIIYNLLGYDKNNGTELWKQFSKYIDDGAILDEYKSDESFEYKKEFVEQYIYDSTELQKKILYNNNNSVLELAELFENEDGNNISDTYDFQRIYIQKYLDENADTDDADDVNETTATALEYLNNEFGLNDKIKTEYKEYMWKVDSSKYNI